MDAFAITGVAATAQEREPEWFRVQGALGGEATPPKLFPRIHVVSRETIADLIAGGRIVYAMRPDDPEADAPVRVRVRVDAHGASRLEAVALGGDAGMLDRLPRFSFAADASDADVEALRAIGRGEPSGDDADVERYADAGWIRDADDGGIELTDIGRDLVRSRSM